MKKSVDIFLTFARIGLFSFGSATSEVIMEQVVEKKRWLSMEAYRDNLSLAALVPGPFHVNLVGMTGNSIAGFRGGLLSVAAFTLPGLLIAAVVAAILANEPVSAFLSRNPGLIAGTLMAIAGLLLNVIVKLGRTAIPKPALWLLVAGLAVLIQYFQLNFAVAVVGLGILFVMLRNRDLRKGESPS